jgi:hypothetical protein
LIAIGGAITLSSSSTRLVAARSVTLCDARRTAADAERLPELNARGRRDRSRSEKPNRKYVAYGHHEPNRRLEAVHRPETDTVEADVLAEFNMPLAADHKSRMTRESGSRSASDWTDA